VSVALGTRTIAWSAAARLRQLTWFGLDAAEHAVANLVSVLPADHPPLRRVDDDPRRYMVNPFRLERAEVEAIHARLAAEGGVVLLGGNTSMLEQWAEKSLSAGLDGRELGLRLIIVGSEVTAPEQRGLIERAFAAPTAEMYGATEAPMIAAECPDGSLHLNDEVAAVEVLRPDGSAAPPGELGEVAITLLHNVEMPMFRYRIGDAAAMLDGPCACGRTLPRLDLRVAHLEEMILTRDGRLLHPRFIRTELEGLGLAIRRFHTVQRGPGDFVVFLDVDGELAGGTAERLERATAAFTGEPASFELVADPDRATGRLPSGKRRAFTRTFAP
jgi:phenylacetate-CoA ligase